MSLGDAEIRRRLTEFATKWGAWQGTEKSEAIPFLIDLLACFGTEKDGAGVRFEVKVPSGWIDMLWPGVCLVEMKRPSETKRLAKHRDQAFAYWHESGTETDEPPKYIVLCSFHRFIVFQPGFAGARADLTLEELPERLDALGFLGGLETRFTEDRADLTREAVALVTDLYKGLVDRLAEGPDTLRDFILQCVWCLFAEDLHLLPSSLFTKLVEGLIKDSTRSSRDELGLLFEYLNTPGGGPSEGRYAGTPYADGQLFAKPARVHLEPAELRLLREACAYNWRQVEPSIFGSLLQGALGKERQWALGAHYTAEADIMHAVGPDDRRAVAQASGGVHESRGRSGAPGRARPVRRARSGVRIGKLPLRRLSRAPCDRARPRRPRAEVSSRRGPEGGSAHWRFHARQLTWDRDRALCGQAGSRHALDGTRARR